MIAMTSKDRSFSTMKGTLSRVFNTDGVKREFIDKEEARTALDFEIIKKPSFDEIGRKIPGHYHLVREDTNSIIPSAGIGEKFQPVQHYSVYDYLCNDIIPKVEGMELETVGTLHGCGTGFITARMGDFFRIDGDDSPNEMRLIISNPCNGLGSLVIGFTTVRIFCQNQIAAARKKAVSNDGFSIHHTKNAGLYVDKAITSINALIEKGKNIRLKSQQMASVKIDNAFVMRMLDRIYPFRYTSDSPGYARNNSVREEVLTQMMGGETAMSIKDDTAWKLFNAFSFPIYNPSSLSKRMDAAEIVYTGAIGQRAEKVKRIFDIIYQEAQKAA